jgi:hypothetical protein
VHDWSKFSWTEWTAYANYFYGDFPEHDPNDPNKWTRRGYYGPTSIDIEEKFQRAWLHHIHLNDHHPQHWVLLNDDSTITTLNMPFVAVLEMLADWWSAGLTQAKIVRGEKEVDADGNMLEWYKSHRHLYPFSTRTLMYVESILSDKFGFKE